jgi:DNA (cytosine-5)-methyltransferase 1
MSAVYNEFDPYAAQWLRNLIAAGHIAPGEVDERSIAEVGDDEYRGFTQVHLFAGIGGWSLALRLAGWPDERPVWTGSCPCQPFSAAGKGEGFADARHLWPEMRRLVRACRPAAVMGEQVDAAVRMGWLDAVFDDLEGDGYACRAADLPAAGVGAPHIRQRLWWRADRVADVYDPRLEGRRESGSERAAQRAAGAGGVAGGLADHHGAGRGVEPERDGEPLARIEAGEHRLDAARHGDAGGLADADGGNASAARLQRGGEHGLQPQDGGAMRSGDRGAWPDATGEPARPGPTNGFWRDADWLGCRDGKWRPVEPGTFPLVAGLPNGMVALRTGEVVSRVGTLRAAGNSIVPQVAAAFIIATEIHQP